MELNDYKDLTETDRWSVRLGQAFAIIKANGYRLAQDEPENERPEMVSGLRASKGRFEKHFKIRSVKTKEKFSARAALRNRPVKSGQRG